jgi:hypothetical protein
MPSLHLAIAAPSQTTFLVSVALAIVAWISYFASTPYIGDHPSVLLTAAFAYLAAGCLLASERSSRPDDGVRLRPRKLWGA